MRSLFVSALFGIVLLFSSGCSALGSAVQVSNVSTNTIADMQVEMKIGDKVTSTCTVTRVLGIPFGDFSWFSRKLAENAIHDTNSRRNDTGATSDTVNPLAPVIDFIVGIIGFTGTADIRECEKVAAYTIVTRDGADVIYAPRYLSDSTGFPILFRRTEVTLTGYKGSIVGFRQLDSQNLSR